MGRIINKICKDLKNYGWLYGGAIIVVIVTLLLLLIMAIGRQRLINEGYEVGFSRNNSGAYGITIMADGDEQRKPFILKDETSVNSEETETSKVTDETSTVTESGTAHNSLSMNDLYTIEDEGIKNVVDAVVAGEITSLYGVYDYLSTNGYDESNIEELEPAFIELLDYWNSRRDKK